MSSTLSADAKDALARDVPASEHCRRALERGLVAFGCAPGAQRFRTQRPAVARLLWSLLGERKRGALRKTAAPRLRRLPVYEIEVEPRLPARIPAARCDRRMELRGAFLACGSLAEPARGYHLEFVPPDAAAAERLVALLRAEGCTPKSMTRKGKPLVYFKDIDAITRVLASIGAYGAVLHLEDVRALKETKNRIHRLVNTEAANVERAAIAAAAQRECDRATSPTPTACAISRPRCARSPSCACAIRRKRWLNSGGAAVRRPRSRRSTGASRRSCGWRASWNANVRRSRRSRKPDEKGLAEKGRVSDEAHSRGDGMRIGINGFGRIGRNFTKALHRAPSGRRDRRRQRSDQRRRVRAPLQVRLATTARTPAASSVDGDAISSIGERKIKVLAERDPGKLAVEEISASTSSSNRPASSPMPPRRARTSTAAARRKSSSRRRPKAKTSRSSSASTTTTTIPTSTTSSRTPRARRTAWRPPSSRSSTNSAGSRAS